MLLTYHPYLPPHLPSLLTTFPLIPQHTREMLLALPQTMYYFLSYWGAVGGAGWRSIFHFYEKRFMVPLEHGRGGNATYCKEDKTAAPKPRPPELFHLWDVEERERRK